MTENAWKSAARHWWERMRQAERERDELLQKLEELRGQPSGISGEFADLAARIAKADAKHPRELPDGYTADRDDALPTLKVARRQLADFPSWHRALWCEVAEAFFELAHSNLDRLADELLDVATVAMRWRRAVLERESK